MSDLGSKITVLPAAQRIVLAIDTSDQVEAEKLTQLAKAAGTRFVKFGLQLSSAASWQWCSELAKKHGLDWIADAKLNDIPNTVEAAVANLVSLEHPPFAITVHTTAGQEAMIRAQAKAANVKIMGVTILTSLTNEESQKLYGSAVEDKVMQLALAAAEAGLAGIVASPREILTIKQNPATKYLFAMVPGIRSQSAERGDQSRVATPTEAIHAGADLLVIGREITKSNDPVEPYAKIVKDIEAVLNG